MWGGFRVTGNTPGTDGKAFDCDKCDFYKEYENAGIGALKVFYHYFVHHGWYSFKVGFPYFDTEPPDPEEISR